MTQELTLFITSCIVTLYDVIYIIWYPLNIPILSLLFTSIVTIDVLLYWDVAFFYKYYNLLANIQQYSSYLPSSTYPYKYILLISIVIQLCVWVYCWQIIFNVPYYLHLAIVILYGMLAAAGLIGLIIVIGTIIRIAYETIHRYFYSKYHGTTSNKYKSRCHMCNKATSKISQMCKLCPFKYHDECYNLYVRFHKMCPAGHKTRRIQDC